MVYVEVNFLLKLLLREHEYIQTYQMQPIIEFKCWILNSLRAYGFKLFLEVTKPCNMFNLMKWYAEVLPALPDLYLK